MAYIKSSKPREHAFLPKLKEMFAERKIDRREFLYTSTMLGMSAAAAYGFVGVVTGEAIPQAHAATRPSGGTLTFGREVQDPKLPHSGDGEFASALYRGQFEHLSWTHADGVTRPHLLERWVPSDDLRTWDLKLRDNIRYHDGQRLVADHVIANLKHLLSDESGSSTQGLMKSYMIDAIDTGEKDENDKPVIRNELWDANAIEKVDDLTVRLNLKTPQVVIPEHLFHFGVVMMDPASSFVFEPGASGPTANGTGPFRLTEYDVGRQATMVAQKDYWGRGLDFGNGPVGPYLDKVQFIAVGDDPNAYTNAIVAKQVMCIVDTPFSALPLFEKLDHVTVYDATTSRTMVVRMRVDVEPFTDVRVRQAIRLATNRDRALAIGLKGLGSLAEHHHVAPVQPDYHPLPEPEYNPEKARMLLVEAGYPNGIDVELTYRTARDYEVDTVQVLAEDWKAAGIRLKLTPLPSSAYWANWTNWEFAATGWTAKPLGVMMLALAYRSGVPWNESHFSDQEFDDLLTTAEGIADPIERSKVIMKLEEIMQERGPLSQPWWVKVFTVMDKRIVGYHAHGLRVLFYEELALQA